MKYIWKRLSDEDITRLAEKYDLEPFERRIIELRREGKMLFQIAFVFVDEYSPLWIAMRLIGRLTAPIMCFCVVEGFYHTRNRFKYLIRMAVFAVLSQPFYLLMIYGRLPCTAAELLTNWNVMYTFCVCLVILSLTDRAKTLQIRTKHGIINSAKNNRKGEYKLCHIYKGKIEIN